MRSTRSKCFDYERRLTTGMIAPPKRYSGRGELHFFACDPPGAVAHLRSRDAAGRLVRARRVPTRRWSTTSDPRPARRLHAPAARLRRGASARGPQAVPVERRRRRPPRRGAHAAAATPTFGGTRSRPATCSTHSTRRSTSTAASSWTSCVKDRTAQLSRPVSRTHATGCREHVASPPTARQPGSCHSPRAGRSSISTSTESVRRRRHLVRLGTCTCRRKTTARALDLTGHQAERKQSFPVERGSGGHGTRSAGSASCRPCEWSSTHLPETTASSR